VAASPAVKVLKQALESFFRALLRMEGRPFVIARTGRHFPKSLAAIFSQSPPRFTRVAASAAAPAHVILAGLRGEGRKHSWREARSPVPVKT